MLPFTSRLAPALLAAAMLIGLRPGRYTLEVVHSPEDAPPNRVLRDEVEVR